MLVKPRCSVCGEPVHNEQGYHTGSLDHYDCHTKRHPFVNEPQTTLLSAIRDGDRAMNQLRDAANLKPRKPRARAGEGKLAQHVTRLTVEALERVLEEPVSSANLWLQAGDYRGPKWDLDSWGVDAVIGTGHWMVTCSSLEPMRNYRSCKVAFLNADGQNHYHITSFEPVLLIIQDEF